MTAKELLIPRFEVIAEYPNCLFKKGTILTRIDDLDWYEDTKGDEGKIIKNIFLYPHLFKPLNWWEYRTVEQMPKKIVANLGHYKDEIRQVERWDLDNLLVFFDTKRRQYGCFMDWTKEQCYLPID